MTSLTRGPNNHSRKAIGKEQVRALMAMRRSGMSCSQVAKELKIGESTVARYSSAWWQKEGNKKFAEELKNVRSSNLKKARVIKSKKAAAPKRVNEVKKVGEISKADAPQLSQEQIDYIRKIYQSRTHASGTFIGNLFIRIGKFFGGHHSV